MFSFTQRDADGDAVFLCNDPLLIKTKIKKPIIIDIEDKATAAKKPYTKENLIEYEMATRDSRIGELTNTATAILNQYTDKKHYKVMNSDNISLLRVMQGKEIDALKTGIRWHMNKGLRKYAKKLPYFLLYNYPKKMERYKKLAAAKKHGDSGVELNAYHSPSPLNEICDYVETWEKRCIVWNSTAVDTRCLTVDRECDLSSRAVRSSIMQCINRYSRMIKAIVREKQAAMQHADGDASVWSSKIDMLYNEALQALLEIVPDRCLLANYAIDIVYSHANQNQGFVWKLFGDEIINNLKKNTPVSKRTRIVEVPYATETSVEYLGKYYELISGVIE